MFVTRSEYVLGRNFPLSPRLPPSCFLEALQREFPKAVILCATTYLKILFNRHQVCDVPRCSTRDHYVSLLFPRAYGGGEDRGGGAGVEEGGNKMQRYMQAFPNTVHRSPDVPPHHPRFSYSCIPEMLPAKVLRENSYNSSSQDLLALRSGWQPSTLSIMEEIRFCHVVGFFA